MLLPKAIGFYKTLGNPPKNQTKPIRPLPRRALYTIIILVAAATVFLIRTLPIFAPENVFRVTASQPGSSPDLMLQRLSTVRNLTPSDAVLRAKFVSKESRLFYFKYGPETVLECPFCLSDQPQTYFFYALPALATPHLINLILIGIATAQEATGPEGSQWRTLATYVAVGLATLDLYLLYSYDISDNKSARVFSEVDFFFWRLRSYRFAALAFADNVLAALLYYSTTYRAFVLPQSTSERIDGATRGLMSSKAQLHAAMIVKNTATRDEELRAQSEGYWRHEVAVTQELMQDPEVMEGINYALREGRIDSQAINSGAETYVNSVLEQAKLHVE